MSSTQAIGVLFPGQGSQAPGMGRDLCACSPAATAVFDQVGEATGLNMRRICWELDEAELRQTQNAQMALFTCGVAAYAALRVKLGGIEIGGFAGHSVGEYAALAAAGVLSLEEGARLVQLRGELMAGAGSERPGTMAAVLGLSMAETSEALRDLDPSLGVAVVANDNCPGQVVISGDVDAVHAASALLPERGAKRVLPLNVSGAFHSPLMESSAAKMGERLRTVSFAESDSPVYSNVTAEPGSGWESLLEDQLRSPVRWTEIMQRMTADGMTLYVECGAGEVLGGLMKRIAPPNRVLKVVDSATLDHAVASLS